MIKSSNILIRLNVSVATIRDVAISKRRGFVIGSAPDLSQNIDLEPDLNPSVKVRRLVIKGPAKGRSKPLEVVKDLTLEGNKNREEKRNEITCTNSSLFMVEGSISKREEVEIHRTPWKVLLQKWRGSQKKKKRCSGNEESGGVSELKLSHQVTLGVSVEKYGLSSAVKKHGSVRRTEYSKGFERGVQTQPLDPLIRSNMQPLDLIENPHFLYHVGDVTTRVINPNSDIAKYSAAEIVSSGFNDSMKSCDGLSPK